MSEMIEQVAKAISEKSQVRAYGRVMTPWRDPSMADTYIENRLDEARAAVEAMREPTQGMLDCRDAFMKKDDALTVWRLQIDVALGVHK